MSKFLATTSEVFEDNNDENEENEDRGAENIAVLDENEDHDVESIEVLDDAENVDPHDEDHDEDQGAPPLVPHDNLRSRSEPCVTFNDAMDAPHDK